VAAVLFAAQAAVAESTQEKLDRARTEHDSAQQALSDAEAHLSQVESQYQALQVRLEAARSNVVAAYAAEDELAAGIADAQDRLDQRVTRAYELGPATAIDMFLSAQSTADFASIEVYAASTFQVDDSAVSEVTGLKAALAGVVTTREGDQRDLAATIRYVQTEATQADAERAEAEGKAVAAGLKVKRLELEERELEEARAAAAAALSQYLGTGEVGQGCASGFVHDLIVAAFSPLGQDQVTTALVVATRESNCRPEAYNPTFVPPYGNASGVFQILVPGIWDAWSARCGSTGRSAFDPAANVSVAACVVADEGWWPWGF
jgi:peptidoglycan hydrolase CwlO-like protein